MTSTSQEETAKKTSTTHEVYQQHLENKVNDNVTIYDTFVDVCAEIAIAVAENKVALPSPPPVQEAQTSTPVPCSFDDEVPLSTLIPKGFKIKKIGTTNRRITRSGEN